MKSQKPITKKELKSYFTEQGVDIDKLFNPEKYDRYTYENYKRIKGAVEHYTDWDVTEQGIEFVHPDYPDGRMRFMKVESINNVQSVDEYLELINHLRDTDRFLDMIEQAVDKAEEIEFQEHINELLEKKYGVNLDHVISMPIGEERNSRLNEALKDVAHAEIKDGNIIFYDPLDQGRQLGHSNKMSLDAIQSPDHFVNFASGVRLVRNVSLRVESDYVRQGRGISKRAIDRFLHKLDSPGLEKVLKERDKSGFYKEKLEAIHFYFSEVYRDRDNDMVITLPDEPTKSIAIPDLKSQDRYFEDISSVDQFIDMIKRAREDRDDFYKGYERQMERLKNLKIEIQKGSDHER